MVRNVDLIGEVVSSNGKTYPSIILHPLSTTILDELTNHNIE